MILFKSRPEKGPHKSPYDAPRGPLPNPLGALWGPPKLGGPVTLSRVLPPVGGPRSTEVELEYRSEAGVGKCYVYNSSIESKVPSPEILFFSFLF